MSLNKIATIIADTLEELNSVKDNMTASEFDMLFTGIIDTLTPIIAKTAADGGQGASVQDPQFIEFMNSFVNRNTPITRSIGYIVPRIQEEIYKNINPSVLNTSDPQHESYVAKAQSYRDYADLKPIVATVNTLPSDPASVSSDDLLTAKNISFKLSDKVDPATSNELASILNIDSIESAGAKEAVVSFKNTVTPIVTGRMTELSQEVNSNKKELSQYISSNLQEDLHERTAYVKDTLLDIIRLSDAPVSTKIVDLLKNPNTSLSQIDVPAILQFVKDNKVDHTELTPERKDILAKTLVKYNKDIYNKLWEAYSTTIDRVAGEIDLLDETHNTLNEYYHILVSDAGAQYVDTESGTSLNTLNEQTIRENKRQQALSKMYKEIKPLIDERTLIESSQDTDEVKSTKITDIDNQINKVSNRYGASVEEAEKAYTELASLKEKAGLPYSSIVDRSFYAKSSGKGESASENAAKSFEVVKAYQLSNPFISLESLNASDLIEILSKVEQTEAEYKKTYEQLTFGLDNISDVRKTLLEGIANKTFSITDIQNICKQHAEHYSSIFKTPSYLPEDLMASMAAYVDADLDNSGTLAAPTDAVTQDVPVVDNYSDIIDTSGAQITQDTQPTSQQEELPPADDFADIDFSLPEPDDNTKLSSLTDKLLKIAMDSYKLHRVAEPQEVADSSTTDKLNDTINSLVGALSTEIASTYDIVSATPVESINDFSAKISSLITDIMTADDDLASYAQHIVTKGVGDTAAYKKPLSASINSVKQSLESFIKQEATEKPTEAINNQSLTILKPKIKQQQDLVSQYTHIYNVLMDSCKNISKKLGLIITKKGDQVGPSVTSILTDVKQEFDTFINAGIDNNTKLMYNAASLEELPIVNKMFSELNNALTDPNASKAILESDIVSITDSINSIDKQISKIDPILREIKKNPNLVSDMSEAGSDMGALIIDQLSSMVTKLNKYATGSSDTQTLLNVIKTLSTDNKLNYAVSKNSDVASSVASMIQQYNDISKVTDTDTIYDNLRNMLKVIKNIKSYVSEIKQYILPSNKQPSEKSASVNDLAVEYLINLKYAVKQQEAKAVSNPKKSLLNQFGSGKKRTTNVISKSSTDKDTADVYKQKTLLAQNTFSNLLGKPISKDIITSDTDINRLTNLISTAAKLYSEDAPEESIQKTINGITAYISNSADAKAIPNIENKIKSYFDSIYGTRSRPIQMGVIDNSPIYSSSAYSPMQEGKSAVVFDFIKKIIPATYDSTRDYLKANNYPVTGFEEFVDTYRDPAYPGLGRRETEIGTVTQSGGLTDVITQFSRTLTGVFNMIKSYADSIKPMDIDLDSEV